MSAPAAQGDVFAVLESINQRRPKPALIVGAGYIGCKRWPRR